MLFKLAFRNVRRQLGNYLIYFITVTVTVALIFAVNNMILSDVMEELKKYYFSGTQSILIVLSCIVCIIVAVVLSYVSAFLLRRRKKEFGLYLTMGMTRGNILAIFAGETLVTFALSLGAGLLLGMLVYQGLMAVFISFMGMDYVVGNYPASSFLMTVGMVVVMFAVSSAASLGYLRFAKISKLLNGDRTFEKSSKYPVVWIGVTVAGIALLAVSIVMFTNWLDSPDFFNRIPEVASIAVMFIFSVVIVPAGIAKSVVPLCIKYRVGTKGTGIFTLRQLSGRLNGNAALAGVLSLLLVIAVITPNVVMTQNATVEAGLDDRYPVDIRLEVRVKDDATEPFRFDKCIELIGEYADIRSSYDYTIYEGWNSEVVSESDYGKACAALGIQPHALNGGYYALYLQTRWGEGVYPTGELEAGGVSYSFAGAEKYPDGLFDCGADPAYYLIAPDEAVKSMRAELCYLSVNLQNRHYAGAMELDDRLYEYSHSPVFGGMYMNRDIRERERSYQLGAIALFLLGCLFISAVFILLSMAMLALKMLSMLAEDKGRYITLWRLGASNGTICKSLFTQMFFFYFLPFVLPFALSGVLSGMLGKMVARQTAAISTLSIAGQVLGFTAVILALYALYFAVTFLIAYRDVKKSLHPEN